MAVNMKNIQLSAFFVRISHDRLVSNYRQFIYLNNISVEKCRKKLES
jgi:hypothetical protein